MDARDAEFPERKQSVDPRHPGKDLLDSADADVDLSDSDIDMESPGDAYRRRKAQMNGRRARTKELGSNGVMVNGHKHKADGVDSDFDAMSASEDLRLDDPLASEDGVSDDEETGLTKKARSKRKTLKKRTTDLDARIGGTSEVHQTGKPGDRKVMFSLLINVVLIGSWYLFSLLISLYNKWMFSKDHLNFHFPLFTTSMHMVVQFCLASTVLFFVPKLRPQASVASAHDTAPGDDLTASEKPAMTRWFYLTRCVPCGAATGLDIGLGNMSLRFITLTFYTMCKSSSLAFVLSFAFLFRLEKPSVKLILIIATMTIGVIMMVAGETEFQALGFILVMLAAFFSGFRWSLTQILLLRSPATSNPFSSIFFLAPVMFLSLFLIAIPVEGFYDLAQGLTTLREEKGLFMGICLLLFPGLLAFLMTASEFALLQRTSVVTLSICGIFKEVVTISAAGIVFGDPLTPINVTGLLITIASIAAYNYFKITKMRAEARMETENKREDVSSDIDEEGTELMRGHFNSRGGRTSSSLMPEEEQRLRSASKASVKSVDEHE